MQKQHKAKAGKHKPDSTEQCLWSQLDILEANRNKCPNDQILDALKLTYENLKYVSTIESQNRMNLLLSVQNVINCCIEENTQSKKAFKWCELILLQVKNMKPEKTSAQTSATEGDAEATAAEETPLTIKSCRKLLDAIVAEYKRKWKADLQDNYPHMKTRNSASGKKVVKSLSKYEAYILKTLWARWSTFAKKVDRNKDQNEMQKILRSTADVLRRIAGTMEISMLEKWEKQSGGTHEEVVSDTVDVKVSEVQHAVDECLEIQDEEAAPKQEAEEECKEDWFVTESNPFLARMPDHIVMPIYESPNPNSSSASAHVENKHFVDLNMVSLKELYEPNDLNSKQLADGHQEWNPDSMLKGNPRWMEIKRKLIQKGVMVMKVLHVSLPVHRSEFIIGKGSFGFVEFAFSQNFHGIALKRLTEYGQLSPRRCEGIREALKEIKNSTLVESSTNLLQTVAFQDMCGYTMAYTMLCDYNLTEYLLRFTHAVGEDALTDERRKDIIEQIVNGLGALHLSKKPIVHGNLKPSNVLITLGGVVKLSEFGFHQFLFDNREHVRKSDQLWWPEETLNWFKMVNTYSCTTMSDIYTCGLLILYVQSNGTHPSTNDTIPIRQLLENRKSSSHLEEYNLVTQMLQHDSNLRPTIVEVHNHIFFWTADQRTAFLQTCISVANTDFAPFFVERQVAQNFCATLEQIWSKDNTKMFWMAAAFMHFGNIEAPFGAKVDSALGLLKFLGKCKNENRALFNKPGLIRKAYPALAFIVYSALRLTNWFEHDKFLSFSPNKMWRPMVTAAASSIDAESIDDDDMSDGDK